MLYTVEERSLYFILLCIYALHPRDTQESATIIRFSDQFVDVLHLEARPELRFPPPYYVMERTVPMRSPRALVDRSIKDRTERLHNLHRDRDLTLPLPPFSVAM